MYSYSLEYIYGSIGPLGVIGVRLRIFSVLCSVALEGKSSQLASTMYASFPSLSLNKYA